jgi:hypothetical protein
VDQIDAEDTELATLDHQPLQPRSQHRHELGQQDTDDDGCDDTEQRTAVEERINLVAGEVDVQRRLRDEAGDDSGRGRAA